MRVYVGQIYLDQEASFPFSAAWQKFMSEELSRLLSSSIYFDDRFGNDQNLVFNVSAKKDISLVEVKGPTHFKRDKDVEYTIFLPHAGGPANAKACEQALQDLFLGVAQILISLQIGADEVRGEFHRIVEHVMADPAMFEA